MIWAALLLTAAVAEAQIPPLEDERGELTLFGLYDNAVWAAHPGCLGFRSNRERGRYERFTDRLRTVRTTMEFRFGAEVLEQYHDQHSRELHGIYYIRCPEVDRGFNSRLNRAIERVERALAPNGEAG